MEKYLEAADVATILLLISFIFWAVSKLVDYRRLARHKKAALASKPSNTQSQAAMDADTVSRALYAEAYGRIVPQSAVQDQSLEKIAEKK